MKTASAADDLEPTEIVEAEDRHRDGFGTAAVEQDRGAELAERRDEDQRKATISPGRAIGTSTAGSSAARWRR